MATISVSNVLTSINDGDTSLGSVTTNLTSFTWSIKYGGNDVSIDQNGNLTLNAPANYMVIQTHNPTVEVIGNGDDDGKSTTVAITINVIDTTAPVITSIGIVSSNNTSTTAKTDDTITLTFTSNEELQTPNASFFSGGNAITDTPSNSVSNINDEYNYTFSYTTHSSDTDGDVTFSIPCIDLAGNTTTITTVTDGSSIKFDKTNPEATTLTIVSDNLDNSVANVGNVITVTLVSNEDLASLSGTIANAAVSISGSNQNWTATYTLLNSDNETTTIPFSLTLTDLAGNQSTLDQNNTTDGSSINFDKTNPDVTSLTIVSDNTDQTKAIVGDTITINLISNENLLSLSGTIHGNSATTSGTDNVWSVTYTLVDTDNEIVNIPFSLTLTDLAGNQTTLDQTNTTDSSSIIFDKTNPGVTSLVIVSDNTDATRSKVGDIITISLTSNENLLTLTGTIHGNTITATGSETVWNATYTLKDTDSETAIIPFSLTMTDLVGNQTNIDNNDITNGSVIIFDKTNPTVTVLSIVSNNDDPTRAEIGDTITVNLTSDENLLSLSGTIHGNTITATGSETGWNATYTLLDTDSDIAIIPFSLTITDLAGNQTIIDQTNVTDGSAVNYDKTNPELTAFNIVSTNNDPTRATVGDTITITVTINEALSSLSGTIANATATVSGSDVTWTVTYTLTDTETDASPMPFSLTLTDLAGNQSIKTQADVSSSIIFDKTPPVITSNIVDSINDGLFDLGTVTADENVSWGLVDLSNTGINIDTDTGVLTLQNEANFHIASSHNFEIKATDLAGNQTVTSAFSVPVNDITKPTVINVTSATPDGSYKVGDIIELRLIFDEVVNVTGTPYIKLNVIDDGYDVNYTSGTGSDTLVFEYTILDDHNTIELDYQNSTSLYLNDGTIKDNAGNDLDLALAYPGDAKSLSANSSIIIDTVPIVVLEMTIPEKFFGKNDSSEVTIKFNKSITLDVNGNYQIVTANGTMGNPTTEDEGFTWKASYIPNKNTVEYGEKIILNRNYTDSAGNTGPSAKTSTFDVDTVSSMLYTTVRASPPKDITGSSGGSFSMGRFIFTRTSKTQLNTLQDKQEKKWYGGQGSATNVIERKKNNAIGGGSLNTDKSMVNSFSNNRYTAESALRRLRS